MKKHKPKASELIGKQLMMWNMSNDYVINSSRLSNVKDPISYLFKMMKSKYKTEPAKFDISKDLLMKLILDCHIKNFRIDIACNRNVEEMENFLNSNNIDFDKINGKDARKLTNETMSKKTVGLWHYDMDYGAEKNYKFVINSGTTEFAVLSIESNLVD